jgi:signal transduction histidine kinase
MGKNVGMADSARETELGRLLQLAGHELRSPLGAVAGYIRMVIKGQIGPVSEAQERILREAERSAGRLKNVLDEMSLLARIDRGDEPFQPAKVELGRLIQDAIAELPEHADRPVTVEVQQNAPVHLLADPTRLKLAFTSVCFALRRELVDTDQLIVRIEPGERDVTVGIAAAGQIDALVSADESELTPFDDPLRGGCGLKLPIAQRIIERHRGVIRSAGPDSRASAVIRLPLT